MKLYTEEQVKQIVEKSRETGLTAEYLMLVNTPIELPTDEEIEKIATKLEHYEGAMWLKYKIVKQIQGGDK